MTPADRDGRRLAAGDRLLQYEVLDLLGVGGMGEKVYRARDERLGREVAIKVLPAQRAGDPAVQARFEREARAVATLSHPGIVTIYEFARERDLQLVVMELLRGETLRQRLDRERIPWLDAVALAAQMADALAAAHAEEIVHRDLKPENTFLTRAGAVKILDFGLATGRALLAGSLPSGSVTAPRASVTAGFAGTLGYAAPEQLRGEPVDARADVFAMGAILYELVTGRRAFAGATAADVVASVLAREPAPLAAVGADTGRPRRARVPLPAEAASRPVGIRRGAGRAAARHPARGPHHRRGRPRQGPRGGPGHDAFRPRRDRQRTGRSARGHCGGEGRPSRGDGGSASDTRRRLAAQRHHPHQDAARGGDARRRGLEPALGVGPRVFVGA